MPIGCSNALYLHKDRLLIRSVSNKEDFSITYDELLAEFNRDSIKISDDEVSSFIQSFGVVIILVSPIFIFLGQILGRLFMILIITLLGFIALSVMKEPNAFSKSFILTMYALIPVYYINIINWILVRFARTVLEIGFNIGDICCLLPLILSIVKWGIFWGIGAWGVSKMKKTIEA